MQTRARQRLLRRRARLTELPATRERQRRLTQVDAALRWIDAGRYGRCSVCAQDLDPAQLEDDPAQMTCLHCRRTAEENAARARARRAVRGDALPFDATDAPGAFGLVSLSDADEVRQQQFEAASRTAST